MKSLTFWCIVFEHTLFWGQLYPAICIHLLFMNSFFAKRKGINVSTDFLLRRYDRLSLTRTCVLIFLWFAGLVTGIYLLNAVPISYSPAFIAVVATKPSLFGLIIASAVPLALCALGIHWGLFWINCVVVLFEAVCRGFCSLFIYQLIGNGAWLLRCLFFLSSTVSAVLMWWILLAYCACGKSIFRKNLHIAAVVLFLFVMVDRLLVSPFLIRLSMYF